MQDRHESAPVPHACALVDVDSQRRCHSWSARRMTSAAAVIWTAAGLAGTGSVLGRYEFSCSCQTAARGSCMVRAAPVRAQTRTSTDPPISNYFCRPPLSWGPAGAGMWRDRCVSIARGAHLGCGKIRGIFFFKNLEVDLLRII